MNKGTRSWRESVILLMDIGVIILCYLLSYLIRFDGIPPYKYVNIMICMLPIAFIIRLLALFYFKIPTSMWQYASVKDLIQIIKAVTASSVIIIAIGMILHVGHPRSIFVIDWLLLIFGLSGVRFMIRLTRPLRWGKPKAGIRRKKVLVVGAGDAGEILLREILYRTRSAYDIVGLIDDDPKKHTKSIHGVKVLGNRKEIVPAVDKYGIEEIIIAIPSAEGKVIRDIISHCQIHDVKVKIVPGLFEILNGALELKLREVRPEDLLGRETVKIDETEVKKHLRDKRVLVTGASGSIGSELCRQVSAFSPKELILFDYNENDIYFLEVELRTTYPNLNLRRIMGDVKDIGLLKNTFSKYRPQLVFHAAAFKHVPLMEESPSAAVKNNVIATRNLIYAAEHYRVENFVYLSSDKAVNPTSIMGATKRLGEMVLQAKAVKSRTKFMAVRFGNVLGSKGSVVPLFKKQIEERGPVTVTHPEVRRFFMSTREAVQLVLQAGAMGKGGEIFVLDMGQQIKIIDLARDLISLSGFEPDKDILIKYIGLRPGEKLYEEMLLDTEKDQSTKHDKIYVAQPNNFDCKKVMGQVKELERLAHIMDDATIARKIKEIVPSYNNASNKKD